MGSPITSWEGAAAVFTGADSSGAMLLFLLLAIALTVWPIIQTAKYETEAYKKHKST